MGEKGEGGKEEGMDGGEGRGGEKRRDIIHIGHSTCLALLAWVVRGGAEFEQCQIPGCVTSVAVLLQQDTKPLKSSMLRIQGTCSRLECSSIWARA